MTEGPTWIEAEREGEMAYYRGFSPDSNPYRTGPDAWHAAAASHWDVGYCEAARREQQWEAEAYARQQAEQEWRHDDGMGYGDD